VKVSFPIVAEQLALRLGSHQRVYKLSLLPPLAVHSNSPPFSLYNAHHISMMTANSTSNIVSVEVGSDKRKYLINETVLTQVSDYFKAALKNPWIEHETHVIHLDDVEPEICKLIEYRIAFQDDMLTRRVVDVVARWVVTNELKYVDANEQLVNIERHQARKHYEFRVMAIKLYVLGDRFLMKDLCDSVTHLWCDWRLKSFFADLTADEYLELITYSFKNIPDNREILGHMADEFFGFRGHRAVEAATELKLPEGFIRRIKQLQDTNPNAVDLWEQDDGVIQPCKPADTAGLWDAINDA